MTDPAWRKSAYCGHSNGCVELAPLHDSVGIRDSKRPAHGHLAISRQTWAGLARALSGEAA